NLNFKLTNLNNEKPVSFSASNTGGNLQDLVIDGADFSTNTRALYFITNQGLEVTNLTTNYKFTKTAMNFNNTVLETKYSKILGNIVFNYKREDLSNFTDKVKITADFNKSKLKVQDLKKFYNELSGEDVISFSGKMKGPLNNFSLKNLKLSTKKGIKVNGDLTFRNAVNTDRGFTFKGDLSNLTATYNELKNILPNVLGKTLPTEFRKLGQFKIKGNVLVTPEKMVAKIVMNSQIGGAYSDLEIGNIDQIDTAFYIGDLELINFDMGKFFEDPNFGKISLKGDVNGRGFTLDNINTTFVGNISQFNFNNYTYKNLVANGEYQNNKFDGDLTIDDENFKMSFKGLADLSSKIHKFDFTSNIAYLNLKETNLFTRDSISVVKGDVALDIEGNTLDDIVGKAIFKNVLYTNQQQEYTFKKFEVTSSLKDSIKTIDVSSKDIANGFISGKFSFEELPKVAQNALGSIYTNYKPYEVEKNQFLDFNFTIYNQIVAVFFPDISIDDQTKIKGKINSDKDLFRVNITSPRIDAFGNEVKNLSLITDNKNPLYNTFLSANELNTDYYKVSKLRLLNLTRNDTLFFKSEFIGGKKKNEDFNLDFFYTFNEEGKSVLGFEKSSFIFKGNTWNINPDQKNTDRITFDLKNSEFNFSQFKLVSEEQKIEFTGSLRGNDEKILLADFTKVKLESFLPEIDSLSLKGKLSGHLDFVQKEGSYLPEASLKVKDFEVNDFKQGDLFINIVGENSYKKYNVNLSIENENVKSIAAIGGLDFSEERPLIDLDVFLEGFKLNAFSPLGKDVLSSLRGAASGEFSLRGFLSNPDMEGTLTLENAGLKFPYLNVDYNFEGQSLVTLSQQSFILDDFNLLDTKSNTKGVLKGSISHLNFKQWFLQLKIESDNLLVLDTKNTEEALYYGSAFIDGSADIYGLTDRLTIDINAKTMPGTVFVVPLKDVETVDSFSLIHFKSDKVKVEERQKEIALEALKGLTLNINLEVTKDAVAQVVIDEVYGSQLSGRGSGNLQIEINTRGKFNMFGDYIVDSGVYDFKYGGIVNKPFVIQKGGTVSWNGNPADANLDVTAVYKAKANPGVLLENFNSNRNIEVDLVARITGGLFNSKQELDIQLTNVDPTIANELEFILNDNNVNEKTTQFISLLAFGNFVNPDRVNFDANATITSTASSAIAAAFSSLLNSPDSKFQLGVDYQQGQRDNDLDRLNIDNQVDLSVSTQVSDRVIINGKVGVPIGTQTQSSVIGEVKVEVLLNKEGNFRGVIFNRQNEIQYTIEDQGYTQGLGLSYQVNFNTLSDLLQKMGLKKKLKQKARKEVVKDSTINKENGFKNFEGN
ncbi:translocation/assembly module TamB domain-containing protein, partial [Polaribacter sp.]|uniref:translocation/assembly module TamB domain-containing protein n=1 Tax=Polaribacter sp. TaxID=1920175 RepID=UPI003F6CF6F6